jgi:hypothetical protein
LLPPLGFTKNSRNLIAARLEKYAASHIVRQSALRLRTSGKFALLRLPLISPDAERHGMAVYRLFKNKAFEPEAISTMTRTYAEVCQTLGLIESNLTEMSDGELADAGGGKTMAAKPTIGNAKVSKTLVAKTVIEYAQRGAHDHRRLRDCVLQALER